ncbi:serine hydrolase [Streptomyces sp. NPDC055005]
MTAGPEASGESKEAAEPEQAAGDEGTVVPEVSDGSVGAAVPDPAPEAEETPELERPTDSGDTTPGPEEPTGPEREPRTAPAAKRTESTPQAPKTAHAPKTPKAGEGPSGEGTTGGAASGPDAGPKAGPGKGTRGGSVAPAPVRVPSWARENAGDGERTSEFVALKPLEATTPAPTRTPDPTPSRTPAPTRMPAPAPARGPAAPPKAAAPAALAPERTREVPQPPRPPLDMLAQLTNTPPPAETPRRTALRRVKIWTPIVLALAGCFAGAQLMRPLPEPKLVAADSAHTIDGQLTLPWPTEGQGAIRVPGSGDIAVFGEQRPVPTASVAKVMTAYVILKDHPLAKPTDKGPDITVDAAAVADGTSEDESRIEGLTAGAKYSQQDMLKMLMIPSGNNVARLLARWDSGTDSQDAFVAKMNAAAAELGMKDTVYTDPSGLDKATVSTAVDQLKLAEAVMKNDSFRAIVKLPNATIPGLPKPIYNNNDSLLTAADLSVKGIKTGSSSAAGGTLLWASFKSVGEETPLILGTMMDQHADGPDLNGGDSLTLVKENSRKVIDAVRKALASTPVIHKGQVVGHVDDGLGGRTPLVATKDLNAIGVPGQRLRLTLGGGASKLPHTAKAGAEVGVLTVGDGDGAKTVPVAVGVDLAEPSFGNRLTRLG